MMVRERITRQGDWLGLNRAAAYTLYQTEAQITLRWKTEHANAQESSWHRNKEWATVYVCVCLCHCTHTLSFVKFLFTLCLAPSLYSSCVFRFNPLLWKFLLFHWFCYVYLLLHLRNWRHWPTSPLLFNNRSWAFPQPCAIPGSDGGVTSCQADCYIAAECQPSPPRQRSTRHVFNNRERNWLQSGSVSELIPVRAQLPLPRWCRELGSDPTQGPLWLIDRLNRHLRSGPLVVHLHNFKCIYQVTRALSSPLNARLDRS